MLCHLGRAFFVFAKRTEGFRGFEASLLINPDLRSTSIEDIKYSLRDTQVFGPGKLIATATLTS